jgi:hypothetical protein
MSDPSITEPGIRRCSPATDLATPSTAELFRGSEHDVEVSFSLTTRVHAPESIYTDTRIPRCSSSTTATPRSACAATRATTNVYAPTRSVQSVGNRSGNNGRAAATRARSIGIERPLWARETRPESSRSTGPGRPRHVTEVNRSRTWGAGREPGSPALLLSSDQGQWPVLVNEPVKLAPPPPRAPSVWSAWTAGLSGVPA